MIDKDNRRSFQPNMARPHVLILGAGASRAAFPNGEASGKRLPVMNDLAAIVGLDDILSRAGISPGVNIEEAYGSLKEAPELSDFVSELETRLESYFEGLRLPEKPTLYDHLVLSLRDKDVIATFNWDPLLAQACARNAEFAKSPRILFLHGNVGVAVCTDCEIVRPTGLPCRRCGRTPERIPLLYPIRQKNYAADPFIAREWEAVRGALRDAYILTIFGYGAPTTDAAAIDLLIEGWGCAAERNLEEVELINIQSPEELRETWNSFIHTEHYSVTDSFYSSWTAKFPRRSCEAMWAQLMEREWLEDSVFPKDMGWADLRDWYRPLLEEEASSG